MSCQNIVGIKNLIMTFRNCDTDQVVGPISHELATDDTPMIRAFEYTNEPLKGGYVKRRQNNASIEFKAIRDLRIPLKDYQGRSAITVQIECVNGTVYTGIDGSVSGDEKSDGHEVPMMIVYDVVDELLPPGALMAA